MTLLPVSVELRLLDPRLHDWGPPAPATPGSAGVDLRACLAAPLTIEPATAAVLIPTGLAIAMPHAGMVGLVLARSGLGHRHGLVLGQAVGTIDSDYRGELFVSAWVRPGMPAYTVQPGDRIAQLVFVPVLSPAWRVVDALTPSARAGGFGSTGAA